MMASPGDNARLWGWHGRSLRAFPHGACRPWRQLAHLRRLGALATGLTGRRIQVFSASIISTPPIRATSSANTFDLRTNSEEQPGRSWQREQECPRLDQGEAMFLEDMAKLPQ